MHTLTLQNLQNSEEENFYIIDINPSEWKLSEEIDAIKIPYEDDEFRIKVEYESGRLDEPVVILHSGGDTSKSIKAAAFLEKWGFSNVYVLSEEGKGLKH